MSDIKDGGPVFPHEYKYGDGTAERADGLSVRDYFAAKAMQGFLTGFYSEQANKDPGFCALWAYEQADAMLEIEFLIEILTNEIMV